MEECQAYIVDLVPHFFTVPLRELNLNAFLQHRLAAAITAVASQRAEKAPLVGRSAAPLLISVLRLFSFSLLDLRSPQSLSSVSVAERLLSRQVQSL
jgi:hypothetical protein